MTDDLRGLAAREAMAEPKAPVQCRCGEAPVLHWFPVRGRWCIWCPRECRWGDEVADPSRDAALARWREQQQADDRTEVTP